MQKSDFLALSWVALKYQGTLKWLCQIAPLNTADSRRLYSRGLSIHINKISHTIASYTHSPGRTHEKLWGSGVITFFVQFAFQYLISKVLIFWPSPLIILFLRCSAQIHRSWHSSSNLDQAGWYCCCCSVTKSCPILCDSMDCSTLISSVLRYLSGFTQTHVHRVSDAIQPSHPLSPPSPSALNLFQDRGLFQWVGSSHQVTKILELQMQHHSFQWIFRVYFL